MSKNTNKKQNNRPSRTENQKHAGLEKAKKAGTAVKSAAGYGVNLLKRTGGSIAVETFADATGILMGAAVGKGVHDVTVVGAQAINNKINMATGKGTVSVKGRFGGWKELSTSDYLAAVNSGKKFKEAVPNYFVNRHADEVNATANAIGVVAGGTGFFAGRKGAKKLAQEAIPTLRKADLILKFQEADGESVDGAEGTTADE